MVSTLLTQSQYAASSLIYMIPSSYDSFHQVEASQQLEASPDNFIQLPQEQSSWQSQVGVRAQLHKQKETSEQLAYINVPLEEHAIKRHIKKSDILGCIGRACLNAGGLIGDLLSSPAPFFAMSFAPWVSDGGVSPVISSKLRARLEQLADRGIYISKGFYEALLSEDIKPAFAEMLLLGLNVKISRGAELSNVMIEEVIASIRENGISPEEQFSSQMRNELRMSDIAIEQFFAVAADAENKIIATWEEAASSRRVQRFEEKKAEVIEAELVLESEVLPASSNTERQLTLSGSQRENPYAIALPNRESMLALGLPVKAIQAIATVSMELAAHSVQGMLQLDLSTDTQKVADAIRVIRMLYKNPDPIERIELLKKLADVFLRYDESQQSESLESIRRIKREVISALKEMGFAPTFVNSLEMFIEGNEQQKDLAIQDLSISLHTKDLWKQSDHEYFAAYLIVRLVLAEIKRGSSKEILNTAMSCVRAIAEQIISQDYAGEYVAALMRRTGGGELREEGSVVYSGLKAMIEAGAEQTFQAMRDQLKPNLFSPTDVLFYKLLLRGEMSDESKKTLSRRIVDHYARVPNLDPIVRGILRESIAVAGDIAVADIIYDYEDLAIKRQLTVERAKDLLSVLDEIVAKSEMKEAHLTVVEPFIKRLLTQRQILRTVVSMKLISLPQFSLSLKKNIYERVVEELYSEFRGESAVLEAVNCLDTVDGKNILAYFRECLENGKSTDEKRFYLRRMVSKIASLERPNEDLVEEIDWAYRESFKLFREDMEENFELILQLYSSPAVDKTLIKGGYKKIAQLEPDPNLPNRELRMMRAMAGNYGFPSYYLAGELTEQLFAEIDKLPSTASSSADFAQMRKAGPAVTPASVQFNFAHKSSPEIAADLRRRMQAFVAMNTNRFSFDPLRDRLEVKGKMTDWEKSALSEALAIGQQEKNRVPLEELRSRHASRVALIDTLDTRYEINVRKHAEYQKTTGTGNIYQIGLDLAVKATAASPRETLAECLRAVQKLILNPSLYMEEREKIIARLLQAHDAVLQRVSADGNEMKHIDEWSYSFVHLLAGMFTRGDFRRTKQSPLVLHFILQNTFNGNLNSASRKMIFKIFAASPECFSSSPKSLTYVVNRLCEMVEKNPNMDLGEEKRLIIALLNAYGASGSVKEQVVDEDLEMRARLIAEGEIEVPI